jgi:Lon-like ATP-dependent protease
MDVHVNLSRVHFVCAGMFPALYCRFNAYRFLANILDTTQPLLDRMQVIEISGYEKSMVAERYVAPQEVASGLKDADVVLDPTAVDVFSKYYCRESGVGNLKRRIQERTSCVCRANVIGAALIR